MSNVYDGLERSWHRFFVNHDLLLLPNLPDQNFDRFDYDCLVLSSGNDSIDRHITENKVFEHAKQKNVPIIGFCHGAFAINDICGGINLRKLGHTGDEHFVTMNDHKVLVNSFHSQYISKLAPGYRCMASDDDGDCEAFEHEFLPIYGVVWHPERQMIPVLPDAVRDLLEPYPSITV